MSWATAIIIIVVVGCVAKVLISRYQANAGIIEDEDGNQSYVGKPTNDAKTQQEIEELRKRIAVLERIATDENSLDVHKTRQIASEIEALREKQDS